MIDMSLRKKFIKTIINMKKVIRIRQTIGSHDLSQKIISYLIDKEILIFKDNIGYLTNKKGYLIIEFIEENY